MSTLKRNIPYADTHPRHIGDLFTPACAKRGAPTILLIHGGGWNALSKESLEPVARLAIAEGHSVFNINYRLLDHAPWPACSEDCIAAARFVLGGGLIEHGLPEAASSKLLVIGASAGGHLAMMTGLAIGARACVGILSLAGPTRVNPRNDASTSAIRQPGFQQKFFGDSEPVSPQALLNASPCALVTAEAPALHILHSRNDRLVPPAHSEEAVTAWQSVGRPAQIDYFDGPGALHGFWTSEDLQTRELIPPLVHLLTRYLHRSTQL